MNWDPFRKRSEVKVFVKSAKNNITTGALK